VTCDTAFDLFVAVVSSRVLSRLLQIDFFVPFASFVLVLVVLIPLVALATALIV
jgi:hypothetical protein